MTQAASGPVVATNDARRSFDADGYVVLGPTVPGLVCDDLLRAIETSTQQGRAGSRRLLDVPQVVDVARILRDDPVLADLLPPAAVAVQCTLFSKQAQSNWSVAPHQDLSIPVSTRVDTTGWAGWSRKQQVWFVQPPAMILEALVAVRLQLDPSDASSGPLRVMPGSHRNGRFAGEALARIASAQMVPCLVERGGMLVMRPLLVHASGKATAMSARRVLHFLYGPPKLPSGVRWANAIQ